MNPRQRLLTRSRRYLWGAATAGLLATGAFTAAAHAATSGDDRGDDGTGSVTVEQPGTADDGLGGSSGTGSSDSGSSGTGSQGGSQEGPQGDSGSGVTGGQSGSADGSSHAS